jgi:hypothetical protein
MKISSMLKILLLAVCSLFVSCTAKVYVQDRHTIMEEEAAGEWPQFEKELLTKSAEKGPTPFEKTRTSARKKRLYNVLNGEMVSSAETPPEAPNKKD